MSPIYCNPFILSFVLLWAFPVFSQDNLITNSSESGISANDEELVIENPSLIGLNPENTQQETQFVQNMDMVVLIENRSGLRLLGQEIFSTRLIEQGNGIYVGLMAFNDQVSVILPLTNSQSINRESLMGSLSSLNVNGSIFDLGRSLERAIYELKYNGRGIVAKKIMLITSPESSNVQSVEAAFSATVVSDIVEHNISLDVIAFGNSETNILTQKINQIQNANLYFVQDISEIKLTIDSILPISPIDNSAQLVVEENELQRQALPQVQQTQPQVNTSTAVISPSVDDEEKTRSIIIIISAFILIITLGALIALVYFRMKKLFGAGNVKISEAFLKDIHGYTSNEMYLLGKKATMLGRVAGKDTDNLDYIVIPETTIGRRHAVIEYKDYAYWIIDQGSINGTFVNNIPVTSEVRLKQGDIVRLHKLEFEFSIPELDEVGKTKISNTVFAEDVPEDISLDSPEIDEVKESISSGGLDFDFGFGDSEPESQDNEKPVPVNDETLLPGHDIENQIAQDSVDETLMPSGSTVDAADLAITGDEEIESPVIEDETLMPGSMDFMDDEDDTIRPNKDSSKED
jgi:pSer/pThr/pTyr-binding forkhead associated (FHA) protein